MAVAVVVALAVLLTLRFLAAQDGYPAILSLRADISQVHRQLRRIHGENEHLEQRIGALRQEAYPIEKLAREELDFAQPGELIYLFPEDLQTTGRGDGRNGPAGEPTP